MVSSWSSSGGVAEVVDDVSLDTMCRILRSSMLATLKDNPTQRLSNVPSLLLFFLSFLIDFY